MYNVYSDGKITTAVWFSRSVIKKETGSRYSHEISRRIESEIDARVAAALPKGKRGRVPRGLVEFSVARRLKCQRRSYKADQAEKRTAPVP
jgi:hypothetical protein